MKLNNKKLDKIRKYSEEVLKGKGALISNGVDDSWSIILHDGSGIILRVQIDEIKDQ